MAYSIPRAWSGRRRHVETVLAPALPALILLSVVTAGMVDPPQSGLVSQLHLGQTAAVSHAHRGSSTWGVTAR